MDHYNSVKGRTSKEVSKPTFWRPLRIDTSQSRISKGTEQFGVDVIKCGAGNER